MNTDISNWVLNKIRNNQLIIFLNPEDISSFIKYNVQSITRDEYDADPFNISQPIVHFSFIFQKL